MHQQTDEFYIGWQAEAPAGFARQVRRFVSVLFIAIPLLGAWLVLNQKGFDDSNFEFGKLSEAEGVLMKEPAPFLRVHRGTDTRGRPVFQHILLVGRGKHGANEMLTGIEKQVGHSLEGRHLRIQGYLIHHDGKTLMELEAPENIVESPSSTPPDSAFIIQHAALSRNGVFMGEITDPKCLFGVMKPGHGKPHRSCAARCIAGGIPPVLKTMNTSGRAQYFLLANESGQAINEELLPMVGEQVMVCGRVEQSGDWLVLYKDPGRKISALPGSLRVEVPNCGEN